MSDEGEDQALEPHAQSALELAKRLIRMDRDELLLEGVQVTAQLLGLIGPVDQDPQDRAWACLHAGMWSGQVMKVTRAHERRGLRELLERHVTTLDLTARSRQTLDRLGITVIGDLVKRTRSHLLAQKNVGQTTVNEIGHRLVALGLDFAPCVQSSPESTTVDAEREARNAGRLCTYRDGNGVYCARPRPLPDHTVKIDEACNPDYCTPHQEAS